ncbi:MAG: hypothetical protein V1885_02335 [Candidatus Brennerbacteria bacterium]
MRKGIPLIIVFLMSIAPVAKAAVPPIASFSASATGSGQATLSWVTPSGTFTGLDIRQSLSPIDEANFGAAPQVAGVPAPVADATQSVEVTGLANGTTYYFGAILSSIVGENSPLVTTSATTSGTQSGGGGACAAVSPVTNFTASFGTTNAVLLWVTPSGVSTGFDVRQSLSPLEDANFSIAPQVAGVPAPVADATQSVEVAGLASGTTYYFGIQVAGICGDVSTIALTSGATSVPPPPPSPTPSGGGLGYIFPPPHVVMNGGTTSTTSTLVTLDIYAANALEMFVSESSSTLIFDWRPYMSTSSWTLSAGDGLKTIYVRFRNSALFPEVASSSITLSSPTTTVPLEEATTTVPIEIIVLPVVPKASAPPLVEPIPLPSADTEEESTTTVATAPATVGMSPQFFANLLASLGVEGVSPTAATGLAVLVFAGAYAGVFSVVQIACRKLFGW